MTLSDHFSTESHIEQPKIILHEQSSLDVAPPIGVTPPQILAQRAADGQRGAAWRLLHRIVENDPQAIEAVTALQDDRLARNLVEFIALGTWAGKSFDVPVSLRSSYTRTRLRTLFLPPAGIDQARAERVLTAALRDERLAVRETAMYLLGIIGSSVAVPELIQALHDPMPSTRLEAVKALGRTGSPEAVPALLDALHGADEQMGTQIFRALVSLGHVAVPALLETCLSSSPWVRWHSVRALGEIHDDAALPALVRALNDTDHSVAWMAAKGLASFGKECVKPILHLLINAETTPWLRETASYVLDKQCRYHTELKLYLQPLLQEMHQSAYREGTGYTALKALEHLETDGVLS
jgi:hypothetical protein